MLKNFTYERFDGLGNSREERVANLEAKMREAEVRGHHDKLENLRRIYNYEVICLQLDQ